MFRGIKFAKQKKKYFKNTTTELKISENEFLRISKNVCVCECFVSVSNIFQTVGYFYYSSIYIVYLNIYCFCICIICIYFFATYDAG